MSVPVLRFSEYQDEWTQHRIGDLAPKVTAGATPKTTSKEYWGGDIRWMNSGELNHKMVREVEGRITKLGLAKSSTKLLPKNCVLIGLAGQGKTRGTVAMNLVELCTNQSIAAIHPNTSKFDERFLYHNLDYRYDELRGLSTGDGGRGGLNLAIIKSMDVYIPSIDEQTKIAKFLMAVDEKITQLTQKYELLAQYKKGVMQQIFSQELRFKDDDGQDFPEWETHSLSYWLSESKARNYKLHFNKTDVLSVSGEFGVVNQIEFMGRSYAGASVHNYHILESGEMVYTKSPLKNNPYGIIKFNKGKCGIVSTLYAVYKCHSNINGEILDYYFQLDTNLNNYLKPLVRKGAKNDMKVNNSHVLTGQICLPTCTVEQNRIVGLLNKLDEKIKSVQDQLTAAKQYKQGLLQQLFV